MTQRLLHRRVAVICAALGAALGLADASKACSRPAAQFSVAASARVEHADAAFVGRLIEIRPFAPRDGPSPLGPQPSILTFVVEQRVKGDLQERIEIVSFGSGMCGIDGTVGSRMGILLTRTQGPYGPWSAEDVPTTLFREAAVWADRAARPYVMQLGRGLGPYRIGMRRTIFSGLKKAIRHRENDIGGCSGGFLQDSFVDVYQGLRLGYLIAFDGRTFLDTIATTRRGDRTSLGFVIGKSTLGQVRSTYPRARITRHLGGSTLSLYHRTGYETGTHLDYSFNAKGTLVRLETGVGGC
jgi:hypothetical protein